MRVRTIRIGIAAAVALMAGSGACSHAGPEGLSPSLMRELHPPEIGQTRAEVVALNGEPDRVEQADGLEIWVYARTLPATADLRSRSAILWFRDGAVVRVGTSGGFSAPNPTFPAPQPPPSASRADAS